MMNTTPVNQMTTMPRRTLGGSLEVSALGFGCMNIAYAYGPRANKKDAIPLFHKAYENGATFSTLPKFTGLFIARNVLARRFPNAR